MARASSATKQAGAAVERAARSSWLHTAARAGFVVAGVLHLIIAGIALSIAFGGGGSADPSGALAAIAANPLGGILVWACAVGLLLLAAVYLIDGVLRLRGGRRDRWKESGRSAAIAVPYAAIGVTAVQVAMGSDASSEGSAESLTARILTAPGGVVLVVLVGLSIVGIGGYFVFSGITRAFEQRLTGTTTRTGRWTVRAGRIGYPAKSVVLVIVGILLVVAAFTNDPENAAGLDGALKTLRDQPFGQVLLVVVALGLAVYGVFLFGRAKHDKLQN